MHCPFEVTVAGRGQGTLDICGQRIPLKRGSYTPWIVVDF
jgi:hypothetical protein